MKQRELAGIEEQLGFRPRAAVRWMSPPQLLRTGIQALLAQTFTGFMDNRETQSMVPQAALDLGDYPVGEDGRWVDFVADLGDGFDATYTVAWLLGRQELVVQPAGDGPELTLPKGQVLIMGGDQVYPSGSARDYEDRLVRPYRAASTPGAPAALLALPGNHDWYDGLTAFRRIFCHRAAIGGWQTLQSRGYFAARLTNAEGNLVQKTWWVVALDSELGAYIDRPQLEYFHTEVTRRLKPGDAIILCAASPTWSTTAELPAGDPNANNSLRYFEQHYLINEQDPATGALSPTGAQIRLRVSGDKHHYSRYEQVLEPSGNGQDASPQDPDPRAEQLVTCGLGGAYLMGTEQLAEQLVLPPDGSREKVSAAEQRHYRLAETRFPTAQLQSRLTARLANPFSRYFLPWRNPWFGFWLGIVHLLLFMLLTTMFSGMTGRFYPSALGSGDWRHALGLLFFVYGLPPLLALAVRVLRFVLAAPLPEVAEPEVEAGAPAAKRIRRQVQPVLIVLIQLLLSAAMFLAAVGLDWDRRLHSGWAVVLCAALAVTVLGASVGSLLFAIHLANAPPGTVGKLKMTGLAYEEGKGFLRLHLRADGQLELYPLLLDKVVHDWTLGTGPEGQPRPEPSGGTPRPRLLEPPVLISMSGAAPREEGGP